MPSVQAADFAHAHALYVGAALAITQGDPAEARQMLEACLVLRRRLSDDGGVAATLSTLSMTLLSAGEAQAALMAEQEALQLFRSIQYRVGESIALQHLGYIELHLGNTVEASQHLEQGAALARELNNLEVEGECELVLGKVALDCKNLAQARAHFLRSLQLCKEAGDTRDAARAQANLGHCDLLEGLLDVARPRLKSALQDFRRFEMREELLQSLEDHAFLAELDELPELSLSLLHAADQARDRAGLARSPQAEPAHRARLEALTEFLGTGACERALAKSRSWTWAEVLERVEALST